MMRWAAMQTRRGTMVLIVVALAGMLVLVGCGTGQGAGQPEASATPAALAEQLEVAGQHLDRAIAAGQSGDMAGLKVAYQDFNVMWMEIGDKIWFKSRESQIAIQSAIDNVDRKLYQPGVTPDKEKTFQALQELRKVVTEQEAKLRGM
ncbi:hypothetical protein [Nitrolancea hollandica]|uniref:DUF4363 family protein n=1 Tax=Nitrolancea hollandica Lb TaxID=1129897 RepID=I4ELU9_9BACT|nr:hypothetical protein [Nitrolancea hollandica]CCF85662.1 exported hypothetical protein [Nitrolancea hollandica Lb]